MDGDYKIKSDKVYNLIKNLTARGCPIDGVGFQNHIDINYNTSFFKSVDANMKRYAELGIKVHITEMDVKCN